MLAAGPCAVESREQAFKIAKFVKDCGATIFRAGSFKGQNRPIVNGKPAFWGLGLDAIDILSDIQKELAIPCVTEVQDIIQTDWAIRSGLKYLQIGARHCQNFPLLRHIAEILKQTPEQLSYNYGDKAQPFEVILKRGLGNTIDEWIGAAEHLGGPEKVILCERGTVHFDRTPQTRWRLDLVGVAYLKEYTDYRVIVDPSHGSGDRKLVPRLATAGMLISDGLMIEVHYDPDNSPTDAAQTIDFDTFKDLSEVYDDFSRYYCS